MKPMGNIDSSGELNGSLRGVSARLGKTNFPKYYRGPVDGNADMATRLMEDGGLDQQSRMIKDKRHAFDMATLYSYQAARVQKWLPPHDDLKKPDTEEITPSSASELLLPPVRALINPNKLTVDYDNKILSIGFEHGYKTGDIFKWCQTNTYWIIYLQDLDELAYFRGSIRKCSYQINWADKDGNKQKTYVAVRGPVETQIDYIQKHTISVDNPNYSLNILMPKNSYTMSQFKRYSKFYLSLTDEPDSEICWRVVATDSISTPGILEVNAAEYYSNEFEDDIENGIADGLVIKPVEQEVSADVIEIKGETFIKPKMTEEYYVNNRESGNWKVVKTGKASPPVKIEEYRNDAGYPCVKVYWIASYSGQFELKFIGDNQEYTKTIVVQSLL